MRASRGKEPIVDAPNLCRLCKQPVIVNAERYDVFEQMHWLCFHLVFEHNGDPDISCGDPDCPWFHIEVYKERLSQLGADPMVVLEQAIKKKWDL